MKDILNERVMTSMEMPVDAKERYQELSAIQGMTNAAWIEAAVRALAAKVLPADEWEQAKKDAIAEALHTKKPI